MLFENASVNFIIRKGAILRAGAKLLCMSNETLEVDENSIVAANAVLLHSISANEVWGLAKKLKDIPKSN